MRARPGRPVPRADPALRPGPHLRRRRPVVERLPSARRARLRADLQRARSRRPTTRSPPDPRFAARPRLPRQPPAGPRGAGRGVLPRAAAGCCPSAASCSAAAAGTTSRCRPTCSYLGHVYTADHNAFNCTPRAVLNVSRDSMARYGFSPATRVFEAAGAGACLITDAWEGIEQFLEPGREVLVARDGDEVAEHVRGARRRRGARAIGSGRAARASWPSTPTPTARRRSSAARSDAAAPPRSRREPREARAARHRHPRACRSPRRGATATPPPTAGWCASSTTRGHDVLFLERDVPWYAENRDLPRPAVRPHRAVPVASTELRDRFTRRRARGGPGDRRARTCPRRRGRRAGSRDRARRRPPSTTSTRR